MKKLSFIIAIFAIMIIIAKPQLTQAQETKDLKEHVCTDACKDGKCVYAHGEKGHVCTDACKTTKTTKTNTTTSLKDHVCTSACKDGKCVYAHGEKGHVCTDACLKKK